MLCENLLSPKQVILLINFGILATLAASSLPMYSLAVLMGSSLEDRHPRHQPLGERMHHLIDRIGLKHQARSERQAGSL